MDRHSPDNLNAMPVDELLRVIPIAYINLAEFVCSEGRLKDVKAMQRFKGTDIYFNDLWTRQ